MAARRLSTVLAAGEHRRSLEAVRDKLAKNLEDASPRDSAAIAGQLVTVLERLDKIPSGREESKLDRIASGVTDELAARREDRQPAAKGASRARGGRSSRS